VHSLRGEIGSLAPGFLESAASPRLDPGGELDEPRSPFHFDKLSPLDLADPGVTCSYDDLLSIDEALTALEQAEPRAARVSELRFFAGLQENEIAEQLGVSEITVKRDWRFARAWLAAYLAHGNPPSPAVTACGG